MPEISGLAQRTILEVPVTICDVAEKQMSCLNHRQQLRRLTVDKLRPQLERNGRSFVKVSIDTTTYALSSFDQEHRHSYCREVASRSEAGNPRANYNHGRILFRHSGGS